MYKIEDIKKMYSPKDVESFIDIYMTSGNIRYDSFDHCYGYFQNNQTNLTGNNMEQSCLLLWQYISSWGMLRNSPLGKNGNYKVLQDTIKVIQDYFNNSYDIPDIEKDSREGYVDKMNALYADIEDSFVKNEILSFEPTDTLVTKIILGVFGAFPALDRNFKNTFGNGTSISGFARLVWDFYDKYKPVLNKYYGVKGYSSLKYPIAKLIDMFGFAKGITL